MMSPLRRSFSLGYKYILGETLKCGRISHIQFKPKMQARQIQLISGNPIRLTSSKESIFVWTKNFLSQHGSKFSCQKCLLLLFAIDESKFQMFCSVLNFCFYRGSTYRNKKYRLKFQVLTTAKID